MTSGPGRVGRRHGVGEDGALQALKCLHHTQRLFPIHAYARLVAAPPRAKVVCIFGRGARRTGGLAARSGIGWRRNVSARVSRHAPPPLMLPFAGSLHEAIACRRVMKASGISAGAGRRLGAGGGVARARWDCGCRAPSYAGQV